MRKIFGSKQREPKASEESVSSSSLVNPTLHNNLKLGLRVLHEPLDHSAAVVE